MRCRAFVIPEASSRVALRAPRAIAGWLIEHGASLRPRRYDPDEGILRDAEGTADDFGCLRCDNCGHERDLDASIVTRVCGVGATAAWRDAVLRALPRFRCSACGARSSSWEPPKEFAVVLCEVCDRPVPPARLAAAPGTTRCVNCEAVSEGGGVEHGAGGVVCRRCGAPMCWRVRRAEEPAKYFLGCTAFPACRYTEG